MTRKIVGSTSLTSRAVRRLAMLALVLIIGGTALPVMVHAAASALPPSFVTYPLNNPNESANDFELGPDGQWWMPPFSGNTIDRVTTAGVDSPLQLSSDVLDPHITAGSDGNLWMSDLSVGSNGGFDKISTTGTLLATYPDSDTPFFVTLGPDGNVWYTLNAHEIGRITPAGVITHFAWPGEFPGPIISGPDGDLWVSGDNEDFQHFQAVIGRVTPSGTITTFPVPAFPDPLVGNTGEPDSLTAGPDGNVWYADVLDGVIGRITPGGVVTQFATPRGVEPADIAAGPDGNLWFTGSVEGSSLAPVVGRITTGGQIGLFDVSSVGSPGFIRSGPDGRLWTVLGGPARLAAFQPSAPAPSPPDIRTISTRYSMPAGGGQVVISGYEIGSATQVLFGSTPATSFSILNGNQLIATVPPHTVGAVDVTVDTPYGASATSAPTDETTGSHFYYQATNCGTVISQSTHLSGDIGPCYTGGVTVAADNVTLNLGGHGVIGFQDPRDGSVVGIDLPQRSGVTIANGAVFGFDAGIHIGGGSGNTVTNMNIHDNIGRDNPNSTFGDGIMIEHASSNNEIVHNVIDHNGIFDGIGVFDPGSDNNTFVNNVVENTVGPTGHAPAGEGIIINGTTGSGASTADRGEQVINNVVRNNASGGIANINEIGGTIENNDVTGNGTTNSFGNGIGVQVGRNWNLGPTQMLIEHNDVRGNGVDGIRLGTLRPPFNGIVEGNTISDNQSVGNGTNVAADAFENFRGLIQAYDLHDLDATCGTNAWSGNQWGSAGFTPSCTSNGGSGPQPTSPVVGSQAGAATAVAPNAVDPTTSTPLAQQWETFLEQGRP